MPPILVDRHRCASRGGRGCDRYLIQRMERSLRRLSRGDTQKYRPKVLLTERLIGPLMRRECARACATSHPPASEVRRRGSLACSKLDLRKSPPCMPDAPNGHWAADSYPFDHRHCSGRANQWQSLEFGEGICSLKATSSSSNDLKKLRSLQAIEPFRTPRPDRSPRTWRWYRWRTALGMAPGRSGIVEISRVARAVPAPRKRK
jgi:hypothetical protein